MLLQCVLLCSVVRLVLSANTAGFRNFFRGEETPICEWLRYEEGVGEKNLTPMEINSRLDQMNTHCESDSEYNPMDDGCLLGYETDELGCIRKDRRCRREGIFEGDIQVNEDEYENLISMYGLSPLPRAARRCFYGKMCRWMDHYDEDRRLYYIPYRIDDAFSKIPKARNAIEDALRTIQDKTCLVFENINSSRKFVQEYNHCMYFVRGIGCTSHVGKLRMKMQKISIGRTCGEKGIVIHEIMHALGFYHEHSRPDRDDYVNVIIDNVKPKYRNDFRKITDDLWYSMNSEYDLSSIMQYGSDYGSIDRCKPTIVKKNGKRIENQIGRLSKEDCRQLNIMYNCGLEDLCT